VQGEGVDIFAGEAFQGGDQVGANPLGREVAVHIGLRVQHPGTAIAAHGHAGHGLDTADHHQVLEAGTHLHRPKVDRLQARRTEAVDLHTGDADVPVGYQRGGLGDIRALVPDWRDATEHDVIHLARVQVTALLQGAEQAGQQVHRLDAVQGAIGLAFAPGRTYRIKDQSLGHDVLEPLCNGALKGRADRALTLSAARADSMTDALIGLDEHAQTNGRRLAKTPG